MTPLGRRVTTTIFARWDTPVTTWRDAILISIQASTQHHVVLQSLTLAILSIFSCELFLLMAAMGIGAFFSNIYYCFDFFVVITSLVLEIVVMTLQDGQVEIFVGLLVFGRIWRFIRIGHGNLRSDA
jgi:hypothetical protein